MTTSDGPSRQQRIYNELAKQYALKTGGGGLLVIAGAAVILVSGMILASLIWFILWNFFDTAFIGWIGWFIVYLLAVVPFLIREERRSRGEFLSDAAAGMSNPADASSYGEYQLDRLSANGAAITEVLLWGPRSLINGLAILRGQEPTRFKPLLERASQIVLHLYDDTEAVEIKKLIQPGDSPVQFGQVMQWLDDNDHIGLSSDRSRVWLSSRLKQILSRLPGLND